MANKRPTRRPTRAVAARAKELRKEMTRQERKLWQRLRRKQLYGLKFRRQHPIYRFILDFYCHQQKLAVELDGDSHALPEQREHDVARTQWLMDHGIRVVRFSNYDVDHKIEGVLAEIARLCGVDEEGDSD